MKNSDGAKFLALINATSKYYCKPPLEEMVIKIYFNALNSYEYKQVEHAIGKHVSDPGKDGKFMPRVSDIIRHIDGGPITADQIIAGARLKETPLGVLCAIHIGSFDLKTTHKDIFYMRQRAEECTQKMPEWKEKGLMGTYSDHEISIMIKYKVDPLGAFSNGLAPPLNTVELSNRISLIKGTKRHQFLLEETREQNDDNKSLVPAEM